MVRFKNRLQNDVIYIDLAEYNYNFYRYLLLEWKFSSLEVGHRTLQEENGRSVLAFIREAVQTLHGDYGLACVQHSLKGQIRPVTQPNESPILILSPIPLLQ